MKLQKQTKKRKTGKESWFFVRQCELGRKAGLDFKYDCFMAGDGELTFT